MPDSRLSRIGETRQEFLDRKTSSKRLEWERRLVRKILHHCGAPPEKFEKGEEDDQFTLDWFVAYYPTFPVRLTAHHEVWKPSIDDLFSPRRAKSIWSRWEDTVEVLGSIAAQGIPIGCVFPTTSGLGDMLLHNAQIENHGKDFTRFVLTRSRMINPNHELEEHVLLEPLKPFLTRSQWGAD